jgi:ABC-type branched-subunit amino acid transport system substrate-binding protein
VTSQRNFPPGLPLLVAAVVLTVLALASFASVVPMFRTTPAGTTQVASNGHAVTGQGQSAGDTSTTTLAPGPGGSNVEQTQSSGPGNVIAPGAAAQQSNCARGRNGGNTDTGVTGTSVKLASTVAESGIGASFLGEVRYGMTAVVNQVNQSGGVCGRRLDLNLVDDGWDATQGQTDLRNFIADGVFALPVVPSSEGLNAASLSHDIDQAQIPVVGTDGMLYSQYSDPWIWPVASSTISTAHIAAATAYKAGSHTFGIVWDSSYKFGKEGESAFRGAISRLPNAHLISDVQVTAGQQDYSSDGKRLNDGCGSSGCDMTFVLLEPSTAETWFSTSGMNPGTKLTEGPQPLFVDTFGQNCGAPCNNMIVWTSYYPPRPPFDGMRAVSEYVGAIRSVSASADVDNQFLEGGYEGMRFFVQALKQVGADLTRQNLRAVLNSMRYEGGLSQPLQWRERNHFANSSMLGFSIQYSQGFNGFQYQQTGWVSDPWVGQDAPSQ